MYARPSVCVPGGSMARCMEGSHLAVLSVSACLLARPIVRLLYPVSAHSVSRTVTGAAARVRAL